MSKGAKPVSAEELKSAKCAKGKVLKSDKGPESA